MMQQCQTEIGKYLCVSSYEKQAGDEQSHFSTTSLIQEWFCMATHNK